MQFNNAIITRKEDFQIVVEKAKDAISVVRCLLWKAEAAAEDRERDLEEDTDREEKEGTCNQGHGSPCFRQ